MDNGPFCRTHRRTSFHNSENEGRKTQAFRNFEFRSNVTHKINEVTNHTIFNIPQIFITNYLPMQTNLMGKFNGPPHHSPRHNRHKSTT
jgi:hypothetical protein